MNILDLYREDVTSKIQSISGGREYRGPCPGCEGHDRFGVYPHQNDGEGSFYCGRGKGVGAGCGKGGDAIAYLREFRNMSYVEACRYLGKEPKGGGGGHYKYQSPKAPRAIKAETFLPEDKNYPEEVVDPSLWHKKGMELVEKSHAALLDRPMSIAYLAARGIGLTSIKKYKLGFHAGETRNHNEYQPSFRPWPSWGLRDEKNTHKKVRKLIIPAGLVIPYIVNDNLHRITIRLIKPDARNPKKKYHYMVGSIRDLWLTNPMAKAFITAEAEFDCIAMDEAAGDLVGTIGIGSTGVRPDMRSAAALDQSICILGGLDNDQAGINAGKWWEETYSQYKRWPVPVGKDPGEAFENGVDLRLWIMAGLPPLFHNQQEQQQADIIVDPVAPPSVEQVNTSNDIPKLQKLIREAAGHIHIYDNGWSVGHILPDLWRQHNYDKVAQINHLLHNSAQVDSLISNLADGLYGADQIRVM